MKFLFFDIDGVLVKPGGYRKAVEDTLAIIARQAGILTAPIAEEIPALFESFGITSEWDMLPICTAILLETYCQVSGNTIEEATLEEAIKNIHKLGTTTLQPDYRKFILRLSEVAHIEEIPSLSIINHRRTTDFPVLYRHPILEDIFCHTRNVKKSYITRLFQSLVLGDALFQKTYQFPAAMPVASYLLQYDHPLIDATTQTWITQAIRKNSHYIAALTARPSLGPKGYTDTEITAYSPEAELALEGIGLAQMPLIGYGRLQYQASLDNLDADQLLKPSAYHTLAALFTGIFADEEKGLSRARSLMQQIDQSPNGKVSIQELTEEVELVVFEDSPGGIQSVLAAEKILKNSGINVHTIAYGITNNPDKMKALMAQGAKIEPTINDALQNYITKV